MYYQSLTRFAPEFCKKNIKPRFPFSILRSQFSLEAASRRHASVACFARSEIFLGRLTVGRARPHCNAASASGLQRFRNR